MKTMIKPPLPQWILDRYSDWREDELREALDEWARLGKEPVRKPKVEVRIPNQCELQVSLIWMATYPEVAGNRIAKFIAFAKNDGMKNLRTESSNQTGFITFIME